MSVDFRSALREALHEALAADDRVVVFSEDVAAAGGVFQVTRGLLERHGPARVFDTPISELALASAAFGSALTGSRPVIEMMFGDFVPLAMDSIINQAAKYWFVSNRQCPVPLVVRSAVGAGGRFGAVHSQIPASWLMPVAGLKVVSPATVADAKALLASSIRDDNPVVFLEHKRLYGLKNDGSTGDGEIGRARVVRSGSDVTLVGAMTGVHESLAAATALEVDGVDCEVIDLRTLRPFDLATVVQSAAATGNLVVVEEGPRTGGWSTSLVAAVVEALPEVAARVSRVTTPDLPTPFAGPLEDAFLPGRDAIAASVRARLGVAA